MVFSSPSFIWIWYSTLEVGGPQLCGLRGCSESRCIQSRLWGSCHNQVQIILSFQPVLKRFPTQQFLDLVIEESMWLVQKLWHDRFIVLHIASKSQKTCLFSQLLTPTTTPNISGSIFPAGQALVASFTTSICKTPKKPHRKPSPKATCAKANQGTCYLQDNKNIKWIQMTRGPYPVVSSCKTSQPGNVEHWQWCQS